MTIKVLALRIVQMTAQKNRYASAIERRFFFNRVKITSHVHNYEHEQIPMLTDLRRRPVMGFLYLGVEAGGVYRWAIGQRLGTPILQQSELPSCSGAGIYAAVQVDPL
jgi:hypothetical protein